MKKLDKKTVRGFAAGALTAVLLGTTVFPAAASTLQSIKVSMGGIKVYLDGSLYVPKDANGNTVEPLIYNGTTYLPLRAAVGMLSDKEVGWDANSETVYIGKRPASGGQSVALDTIKAYRDDQMSVGKSAQFSLLKEKQTPFNCLMPGTSGTIYKLDANYSELNGKFVIPYDDLGAVKGCKLCIYSVDQYGTEQLLDSYEAQAGDAPVDVRTNVRGCDFILIRRENMEINGANHQNVCAFYNVTLTTAQ